MQDRAFPPYRSGGHHATDRARTLRTGPLAPISGNYVVLSCRFHRAGGIDRGGGASRDTRGGWTALRPGDLFCIAAMAVSLVAYDRMPRRSDIRPNNDRSKRNRGGALVRPGGTAIDAGA